MLALVPHFLPLNGLTVLCDALFRVLFTFRSPYLCAVGPVLYIFLLLAALNEVYHPA